MDTLLAFADYLSSPADEHPQLDSYVASKPWYYGTLTLAYSLYCIVRALWEPAYLISIQSDYPTLKYTPIMYYSPLELSCLLTALLCCLISVIFIRARLLEKSVRSSSMASLVCGTIQIIFLLIALCSFVIRSKGVQGNFSIGFTALTVSCFFTFFTIISFGIDVALKNTIKRQSHHQRKLQVGVYITVLYLLAGAVIYKYIEGIAFDNAGQFCLQTFLTIGYGNYTPVTVGGKLFAIVFGACGVVIAGFYFIALEDAIVAYAERQVKAQYAIIQKAKNLRRRRRPFDDTAELDDISSPLPLVHTNTGNSHTGSINSIDMVDLDDEYVQRWHLIRIIISMLIFWLTSSCIFMALQNWSYLDAAYFAFTTMTAIGYGDFIPNLPWAAEYWYFFMLVSVAQLASLLNAVGRQVGHKFAQVQATIKMKSDKRHKPRRLVIASNMTL